MKAIGNLLWFILGGFAMGLSWWILGCLMFVTILGIPWGRSCIVIGKFSFLPFGREAISRKDLKGEKDIGTGSLGLVGNIIWFVLAGFWLAIGHLTFAAANLITIIGIPFGIQHLKLAGVALMPIGKTIVTKELADAVRQENANLKLKELRA